MQGSCLALVVVGSRGVALPLVALRSTDGTDLAPFQF